MSAATGIPVFPSEGQHDDDVVHDELYYQEMYALMANQGGSSNGGSIPTRRPPKLTSQFGGSPLHALAKQQNWGRLLASASVDLLYILDEHHRTPLHYAIEYGADDECILALVRLAPFQVRVKDVMGHDTPIHMACDLGVGLIIMYSLLEADSQIVRRNNSHKQRVLHMENALGRTPLDLIRMHDTAEDPMPENPVATWRSGGFHGVFRAAQKMATNLVKLPWKYHKEDYGAVVDVVEEEMETFPPSVPTA